MPLTLPALGSGHGVTPVASAAAHQFPRPHQTLIEHALGEISSRFYVLTTAREEVIGVGVLDRPIEAVDRIDPGDIACSREIHIRCSEVLAPNGPESQHLHNCIHAVDTPS